MIEVLICLVNWRCQLNCRHCYVAQFRGAPELSTEDYFRMFQEAAELGVRHVGISGGEPLLRRDLMEIVGFVRDLGMSVSIVTNGILLDEEVIRKLARNEVFLYLSVDGDKEAHEALRGEGTWRFVEEALENLKAGPLEFALVSSISKLNLDKAGYVVNLGVDAGASFVAFIPVMPFGNAEEDLVPDSSDIRTFLGEVGTLSEAIDISLWCMPFARRFLSGKRVYSSFCRLASVVDVGVDGDVLLCDVLDISVSNVRRAGLRRAVEEHDRHPLVRRITNPELRGPCVSCPIRGKCLGGCYARSYKSRGHFEGPDPLCPAA